MVSFDKVLKYFKLLRLLQLIVSGGNKFHDLEKNTFLQVHVKELRHGVLFLYIL